MSPDIHHYETLYSTCIVDPGKATAINGIIANMLHNKKRYNDVAWKMQCKIPWWFIGVIHYRESTFNFNRHLHNGDPLTHKTVHVPVDRPLTGNPPFTWEESAVDALHMRRLEIVGNWSIPNALYLLEKYNGMGYSNRALNSPYLWSFTNHYEKGKFVVDGHFDPNTIDKQCGTAAIIKTLDANKDL